MSDYSEVGHNAYLCHRWAMLGTDDLIASADSDHEESLGLLMGKELDHMARKRTYRSKARKFYKNAVYVRGEGRYATVSACDDRTTVELHKTKQIAEIALHFIGDLGCRGGCTNKHKIIDLDHMI